MPLMRYLILFLFLLIAPIQAMEAPYEYNDDATQKLLKKGTTDEHVSESFYQVHWPTIKELILQGADPNARLRFARGSYCVRSLVLMYGSPQDATFLLDHKINIDGYYGSYSALGSLICLKKKELVSLLLERGFDPNTIAYLDNGGTALAVAARCANPEIVQILLSHGADSSRKNSDGRYAVDIAQSWNKKDIIPLLQKQKLG